MSVVTGSPGHRVADVLLVVACWTAVDLAGAFAEKGPREAS
nr:hypothetical protein [Pseudoclavibacter sp. RFBI5]